MKINNIFAMIALFFGISLSVSHAMEDQSPFDKYNAQVSVKNTSELVKQMASLDHDQLNRVNTMPNVEIWMGLMNTVYVSEFDIIQFLESYKERINYLNSLDKALLIMVEPRFFNEYGRNNASDTISDFMSILRGSLSENVEIMVFNIMENEMFLNVLYGLDPKNIYIDNRVEFIGNKDSLLQLPKSLEEALVFQVAQGKNVKMRVSREQTNGILISSEKGPDQFLRQMTAVRDFISGAAGQYAGTLKNFIGVWSEMYPEIEVVHNW